MFVSGTSRPFLPLDLDFDNTELRGAAAKKMSAGADAPADIHYFF
jgi:hypothetical protein